MARCNHFLCVAALHRPDSRHNSGSLPDLGGRVLRHSQPNGCHRSLRNEEDAWTYKSSFTSAKAAYDGLREFAIRTAQETFALLKNEGNALPIASDAKITLMGIRSYAPVYSNSGGSVADGFATVQIFDAFAERGFQLNPSMQAAYAAFFEGKEWFVPMFGGGLLAEYADITSYNDPCELTLDELRGLNPDFNSQYLKSLSMTSVPG